MWSARILSSLRIVGLWALTIKKRLVNIHESNLMDLKFPRVMWIIDVSTLFS
jgi:hypothetical protein